MPVYEFLCENCGPFEVRREIKDASKPMVCPTCKAVAERVFSAPGLIMTPYALRRRIERGVEPHVVRRSRNGEPNPKKASLYRNTGRPWMIDH
jgi:putative FmdB family regulatory protein